MPRKIDHKRISFNTAFGIRPGQLAKEINALPLTARILTIDAVRADTARTSTSLTTLSPTPQKSSTRR